MKLSVIVPVYNEASTIEEVLDRVQAVDLGEVEKEIIVVDDGSTDGTREIVERKYRQSSDVIKVFVSPVNFGKGAAIRIGLKYVTGDIVLIQDADLELDPEEYHRLIAPIQAGVADVVYGSRFLRPSQRLPMRSVIANRILTSAANLLFGVHITDEATAYKVFRAEIIKNIPLQCIRFEFCPEITAKVARKGYQVHEVAISYHPRSSAEGKKVRWVDGLEALWTLVRYRVGR